MKKWKQLAITAISVSLAAQLYFNLFIDGFIITIAVIVFGLCLYLFPEQNSIKMGIVTGIASPLFRGVVLFWGMSDLSRAAALHRAAAMALPDIAFYFSYGIFFYFLYYNNKHTHTRFFFSVMASETLANVVEITVRELGVPLKKDVLLGLLGIACVRSVVIMIVVIGIEGYKSLLANEEHEAKYKALMVMASVFKSEVYFMNKNMVEIEDVMKKTFTLYRTMEREAYPKEMKELTLDIAKDVHEIKKDYLRVIQGLQDNFLSDLTGSGMDIKDIVAILEPDIREHIRERKIDIFFSIKAKCSFYVYDHFGLMAILRNLILNSIDAIGEQKKGMIECVIREGVDEGTEVYLFEVFDNGPGISKNDMDMIFAPGFSTKFNEETGDINRGVGLTLVRDMVQNRFLGTISVDSQEGVYTKFRVAIPKQIFEGERT